VCSDSKPKPQPYCYEAVQGLTHTNKHTHLGTLPSSCQSPYHPAQQQLSRLPGLLQHLLLMTPQQLLLLLQRLVLNLLLLLLQPLCSSTAVAAADNSSAASFIDSHSLLLLPEILTGACPLGCPLPPLRLLTSLVLNCCCCCNPLSLRLAEASRLYGSRFRPALHSLLRRASRSAVPLCPGA